MKKNNVLIWALLLIIVIGGGFFLSKKLNNENENNPTISDSSDAENNDQENQSEEDVSSPDSSVNQDNADNTLASIQNYIEVDKTLLPDFKLMNANNEEISINEYYGKFVVLNFWASWCPPCKAEMPDLQELHNEFEKDDENVLLSVNLTDGQRETKEKADKFLNENNYNFNLFYDYEGLGFSLFNVQSVPSTFFIDEQGYARGLIIGLTNKEDIKTVLETMK